MSFRQTNENIVDMLRQMRGDVDELISQHGRVRQNAVRLGNFVLEAEADTKVKMRNLETGVQSYVGRVVCDCGGGGGCIPIGDPLSIRNPPGGGIDVNWLGGNFSVPPFRIPDTNSIYVDYEIVSGPDDNFYLRFRTKDMDTFNDNWVISPEPITGVVSLAQDPTKPNRIVFLTYAEPDGDIGQMTIWVVTFTGPTTGNWNKRAVIPRPQISDAPWYAIIYDNIVYAVSMPPGTAGDERIARVSSSGNVTYSASLMDITGNSVPLNTLIMAVNPTTGYLLLQTASSMTQILFDANTMATVLFNHQSTFFSADVYSYNFSESFGPYTLLSLGGESWQLWDTRTLESAGFWDVYSNSTWNGEKTVSWWPQAPYQSNESYHYRCNDVIVFIRAAMGNGGGMTDQTSLFVVDFSDPRNPCVILQKELPNIIQLTGDQEGVWDIFNWQYWALIKWDDSSALYILGHSEGWPGRYEIRELVSEDGFFCQEPLIYTPPI